MVRGSSKTSTELWIMVVVIPNWNSLIKSLDNQDSSQEKGNVSFRERQRLCLRADTPLGLMNPDLFYCLLALKSILIVGSYVIRL